MSIAPKTILDGLAFPEGPRWHDGELYFSDMHAHEVVAVKPSGERRTVASFDGPVSGLGWLPDGRMLVVDMEKKKLLRQEKDGQFATHADLTGIATGLANDMVVAKDGTAYVGNFGFSLHPPSQPKAAKLALVPANGQPTICADELMFPNGMVITPDDATLIVGESGRGVLTAFDIGTGGALSNRRLWAELPKGAVPDGICLDAGHGVWAASPYTREVLRVQEGGKVTDRIGTEQLAIACMLGGPDRKTLFILTAEDTDPAFCRPNRVARIQTVEVSIAGAGRP